MKHHITKKSFNGNKMHWNNVLFSFCFLRGEGRVPFWGEGRWLLVGGAMGDNCVIVCHGMVFVDEN